MAPGTEVVPTPQTEQGRIQGRDRPRSALSILTALALAGGGLIFLTIMIRSGESGETDLLVLSALLLTAGAMAATRLRWGPLPGGILGLALTFVSPFFQDFSAYHLTHPEQFALFAGTLLLHGFALVAAVAGLAATWQNYRGEPPSPALPRWTAFLLTGLAGVVVGSVALAGGIAAGAVTPGTDADRVAAGPVSAEVEFTADDIRFTDAPRQVTAGTISVTLVNDGVTPHNIAFDGVEDAQPVVETAAGQAATGTVTLEPGTYTYFCSVPGHRDAGMEGELSAS